MPLTPEQIAQQEFPTRPTGYAKSEVRAFLEKASADYAAAIQAIAETRNEVEANEVRRLAASVHEAVRALLLAAELHEQSIDADPGGARPAGTLDEAARRLIAVADALEGAQGKFWSEPSVPSTGGPPIKRDLAS
jgi:DivIVA domain-containing protein